MTAKLLLLNVDCHKYSFKIDTGFLHFASVGSISLTAGSATSQWKENRLFLAKDCTAHLLFVRLESVNQYMEVVFILHLAYMKVLKGFSGCITSSFDICGINVITIEINFYLSLSFYNK